MIDGFLDGSLANPKIINGFLGHITGGEPVQDSSMFTAGEQIDFVERFAWSDLMSVIGLEPPPAPAATREAAEAARIMTKSILYGAASAIAKETDDRIILTALDRLVQEMIGWRDYPAAAPGLPTLKIPPRRAPKGWWTDGSVIQKRATPHMDIAWPYNFVVWETVSWPQWMEDERRARMEGRFLSGKESVAAEKRGRRKAS